MCGRHPRVKRIVGERLALAARKIAYEDNEVVWTGPVLRSCGVKGRELVLEFDKELLGDDTIMVTGHTANTLGWVTDGQPGDAFPDKSSGLTGVNLDVLLLAMQLGPESPLEIQINGTKGNMTDGLWVPISPNPKCPGASNDAKLCPVQAGKPGNVVTASLSTSFGADITPFITGVRYGWGGNPCCPTVNRAIIPCPPNACPIQTWNSTLPAVPFWATIDGDSGNCSWISTKGGAILK